MKKSTRNLITSYLVKQITEHGQTQFSIRKLSKKSGAPWLDCAVYFYISSSSINKYFNPIANVYCPECNEDVYQCICNKKNTDRLKKLTCHKCNHTFNYSDDGTIVIFELIDKKRDAFLKHAKGNWFERILKKYLDKKSAPV